MKNNIKKLLMLFLITILATTTSFSSTISNGTQNDSIVSLTSLQLKQTNLIFAEHHKLLIENDLLKTQLNNYKKDNDFLLKSDSIKSSQITLHRDLNKSLSDSLKRKEKMLHLWKIGGITVSSSLLLLLLIK